MNDIKLICFDLDETLITHSSWKELGVALGITVEEDRRLYKEYKEGRLSYADWNNEILERYKKHKDSNRENIVKILSKYTYNTGAREAVDYLKGKGYRLALISGSIDILIDIIARDLGIEFARANNNFIFNDAGYIESITHEYDTDEFGKLRHLENFCKNLNIDITECACVADGANDIEMFRKTGHGVTFRGSPIEKDAWKVVATLSDLKDIF